VHTKEPTNKKQTVHGPESTPKPLTQTGLVVRRSIIWRLFFKKKPSPRTSLRPQTRPNATVIPI